MSHSGKPTKGLGLDEISDKLRDSFISDKDDSKPNNLRQPNHGSPVSPLLNRQSTTDATTTSSSSSSSSGSVSGRNAPPNRSSNQSAGGGGISGSAGSSPVSGNAGSAGSSPVSGHAGSFRGRRTGGNVRSQSANSFNFRGGSTATSPPLNALPTGNICPSGITKTGMASKNTKSDVLGSGTVNYGHGSIIRGRPAAKKVDGTTNKLSYPGGDSTKPLTPYSNADELKREGNAQFRSGHLTDALSSYDRGISLAPRNPTFRFNKGVALTGLNRLAEAVKEFEESIKLDPDYAKAHYRLGSILLRLGHVESARRHLTFPGQERDVNEIRKLQSIEMHLNKCRDARKVKDWNGASNESDAAIASGADACIQLEACKAEASLKLQHLNYANTWLPCIPDFDYSTDSCSQSKFFGMFAEAYLYFVRAQIEMALGRFENAVTAAEKAAEIDPENGEVSFLATSIRAVSGARTRGNSLFKLERFVEASAAYGEGIGIEPNNSVLYSNRAACWFKLGMWERSLDDCNRALSIQPNYTKALLRRASSYCKLERWAEAVKDYEILHEEFQNDSEVTESLFTAQFELRKSLGKGGEDEEEDRVKVVSSLEQFMDVITLKSSSSPAGVSLVYFTKQSNQNCQEISLYFHTLSERYPSVKFVKVDVEETPEVATAENVRIVPAINIYKNGCRMKETISPSPELLESWLLHYT
ncbi:TPR repeat-containing thioredoxin TTL1-like [Impatiens glandulifera]|uniref:TPR repeat-containing thioredoxin TTL1-like n=1 Tax=Impatiens glandulifera TaxID=253017 RepID=UPI001FB13765|nr:TPR repeat-containing thioredoxin TTL1-like [Impatiens glandulifera]